MRALTGTERSGLVGFVNADPHSQVGAPPREACEDATALSALVGVSPADRLMTTPSSPQPSKWGIATRRFLAGLCGASALILLALWLLPPLLDWNRYRDAIAGVAATELGRPVQIGGHVTLRLLPAAVLTAEDVTFPDQGDGVSAHLRTLRVEVALGSLLRGRIVARDLTLGEPLLTLPWPLPPTLGTPIRPYVRHDFTARVEHGGVQVGGVAITGIDASVHGDAADGALGVLGVAALAGAPWRFTTSVGAPDALGNETLRLAVDGQGTYEGTQGRFTGTLAPGLLSGRIEGFGPDLARLMPAPATRWHLSGPFRAAAGTLALPVLDLQTADADIQGELTVRITSPAGLEATLSANTLDLASWSPAFFALRPAGLPAHITIDAPAAPLFGDTLHALHAVVRTDGGSTVIEEGRAILPGSAALNLSGKVGRDGSGPWIEGPAKLDAPDLRATLAWLKPKIPALVGALPDRVLRRALLEATVKASNQALSLSDLTGSIDGRSLSGDLAARFGGRPSVKARISTERVALDDWVTGPLSWKPALPAFDADLGLRDTASASCSAARPGPAWDAAQRFCGFFAGGDKRRGSSLKIDQASAVVSTASSWTASAALRTGMPN